MLLFIALIGTRPADAGDVPVLRTADHASSTQDIVDNMRPLPAGAQQSLEALFTAMTADGVPFSPGSGRALIEFVRRACLEDSGWKLASRQGAEGAAYMVKIEAPFQHFLSLNFTPGIPDYAVFPASLRYSTSLDSNALIRVYSLLGAGPAGGQTCVSGRLGGTEEITPNPESGSYFSYTNSRTFNRFSLDGCDVLLSCAQMTSPSTLSNRGAPVGPLNKALYYYSEKPGLNLPGMTWISSQITRSSTLSVYFSLGSNETAAASFAWLNAGWKGMNVIRAHHILHSQITTLDFSRRIAENPDVTAERMAAIVNDASHMSMAGLNTDYNRYLAYVRTCRDNAKPGFLCRSNILQDLYDSEKALTVPIPYRRALIVQEQVRSLLGIATWSAEPNGKTVAMR